jgi:hypothetical protein
MQNATWHALAPDASLHSERVKRRPLCRRTEQLRADQGPKQEPPGGATVFSHAR